MRAGHDMGSKAPTSSSSALQIKQEMSDDCSSTNDDFKCPDVEVVIKEEHEINDCMELGDDNRNQRCSYTAKLGSAGQQLVGGVVIKVENELIIEDSNEPLNDDCEQERCSSENIDEIENNDFDHLQQYTDEDDYMHDDDEDETDCSGKRPKYKSRKGKVKFAFTNDKIPIFYRHYKRIVRLQRHNYIRVVCPLCDRNMKSFSMWARHLNEKHIDFTEEVKTNYDFKTFRRAVCKHCNEQLCFHVNHFLHYLTHHCSNTNELFLCNICNHKDISMEGILDHIGENHNKLNDLYRMCPLCHIMFLDGPSMRHHVMDAHNEQFKTKFQYYKCHLCNHPRFHNEIHYYDHLMNLHALYGYDWEQLNFKQVSGDECLLFECTKCFRCCENTGPHKLLEHYLTHEDNCFWWCKYCESKLQYSESVHICKQMYKFLNKCNIDTERQPAPHSTTHKVGILKGKTQLENWQEFELYIMHICPFCNAEFNDFKQWQLHLRQQHYINSLKGLHLAIVDEDPEQYRCLHCAELIPKNSVNLHTHRFQHLPCMPYKCRHCSKPLKNETVALRHVLNQCNGDDSVASPLEDGPIDMIKRPKLPDDDTNWIEILCALCKNEQFSDISDIESHFRTRHENFEENYRKSSNNLDMVCKKCNTTLRSVSSDICLNHYIKHLKNGPYKCLHCRRSYTSFEICRRHVRRFHLLGARLKKPTKNTKKWQISDYSVDNRIKTETEPQTSEQSVIIPQSTNQVLGLGTLSGKANILNEFQEFITYACAECNDSFDMQQTWSDHIKTQHSFFNDGEMSKVDAEDGKRRCKHCNLILGSSISHRQKHKLTHMPYKSFVCSVCDARCTTLGLLYGHLRRMHFQKGTFECPICLVNLTTSYERSEHVNQTHPRSEWPENMCLICYRNYNCLRNHMLSHDINRPKYVCQICGVSIIFIKDFQIHMDRKHNIKVGFDVKPVVPMITDDGGETTASDIVIKMEEYSNRSKSHSDVGKHSKIKKVKTKPTKGSARVCKSEYILP